MWIRFSPNRVNRNSRNVKNPTTNHDKKLPQGGKFFRAAQAAKQTPTGGFRTERLRSVRRVWAAAQRAKTAKNAEAVFAVLGRVRAPCLARLPLPALTAIWTFYVFAVSFTLNVS
jgi:hypothetical protein